VPSAQSAQELEPGAEYEPAGHKAQAAAEEAPTLLENVPAAHGRHAADELAPRKAPVLLENVPAAHGMHAADELAPTAAE
jgi:hypothetical protein